MKKEYWKDIISFEKMYQISSLGRIKSLQREVCCNKGKRLIKEKILKQTINNKGYYQIQLTKQGKYYQKTVHRLVAEAFINNDDNK